ncbi:hypothetical protein [Lacticaseibacillus jixiensis]|uniref:hypothetical protein n=1 Tax=Lacticaseibacillus jixiensis TaxID=3231926 RepID=UPI0036F401F8
MEILDQSAIAQLNQSKGMQTMDDLAQAVGVNRFTLAQIMRGKQRIVRGETYRKIQKYLAQYQLA